jgi:hypothetical protein
LAQEVSLELSPSGGAAGVIRLGHIAAKHFFDDLLSLNEDERAKFERIITTMISMFKMPNEKRGLTVDDLPGILPFTKENVNDKCE